MGKNTKHDWALKMFLGARTPTCSFHIPLELFHFISPIEWHPFRAQWMISFKRWQDSKLWMLGKTPWEMVSRWTNRRSSSWSSVASWIMSASTGWIQQHRRIKQVTRRDCIIDRISWNIDVNHGTPFESVIFSFYQAYHWSTGLLVSKPATFRTAAPWRASPVPLKGSPATRWHCAWSPAQSR